MLQAFFIWWGEQDSNLRSRKTTELQSVPVGRFGIPPKKEKSFSRIEKLFKK